jgi:hypothetical protein
MNKKRRKKKKTRVVVHAYNPSYTGGQPRQKVNKIPPQSVNRAWWYVPVIPGKWKAKSKRN